MTEFQSVKFRCPGDAALFFALEKLRMSRTKEDAAAARKDYATALQYYPEAPPLVKPENKETVDDGA